MKRKRLTQDVSVGLIWRKRRRRRLSILHIFWDHFDRLHNFADSPSERCDPT